MQHNDDITTQFKRSIVAGFLISAIPFVLVMPYQVLTWSEFATSMVLSVLASSTTT